MGYSQTLVALSEWRVDNQTLHVRHIRMTDTEFSSKASIVINPHARSYSMDDSNVDYMSILGLEDRKRRFSEDVVDVELMDSVRLQKMYRQLQRHVHCHQNKECWASFLDNLK